ncbi:MAG: ABC transporter ATP-binding protein/permease [Bacilli bacterium]|jgi:ABC-type multidrug transport system fused ATPase/permease subunit|nr:ABC transporter ATP-binding protein/permease [Bacilli bacterium]
MKEIKIDSSLKYDKISTYFKTNKRVVFLFSLSGLLFDGLMSLIPMYLGYIINMAVQGQETNKVLINGLLFIALVIFIQSNRFLKRYYVRVFSNRMTYVMRKVSFDFIIHAPIQELNKRSKGDILNRNLTDISDASEGVRKITTEFFDTFILLLGYLIMMFIYDWQITLISMGFIGFSILVAQLVKKPVYNAIRGYKQYLSLTKDQTLYSLKNETYYRGLGVSSYYEGKYEDSQEILRKKAESSLMFKSALEPLYLFIVWLDLFFVIFLGGKRIMSSPATWLIGDFSAYLTTYLLVARKSSRIGKLVNAVQDVKVSWERCKIYLKPAPVKEEIGTLDHSGLKVEDLVFGFKGENIINHLSFEVKPGEIVGVCGRVHTGKSSLLQALNGLYDYKGSIKIGGVETRQIRLAEAKNIIGFCPSNSEIFEDSAENNVSLGKDGPTDKALKVACLDEEMKRRSEEDRLLTRAVANLSGGQQKRLMIARAIYGNPSLVLLDNPFESIDEEMSIMILNNLKDEYKDCAIVLVSNQANILSICDRLLYLNGNSFVFKPYKDLLNDKDFVSFLGGQIK